MLETILKPKICKSISLSNLNFINGLALFTNMPNVRQMLDLLLGLERFALSVNNYIVFAKVDLKRWYF